MKYEEPTIEIMEFEECDVICDSGFGDNLDIDNGDNDGGWE